ncbi:eukaryotic translation initiation factor 3 subunit J isoform X1 [Cricetulus griseus]|uniref:eukaryotic translation initiation factor 3 subunit J isoform X1 n=1 Tax=Cricetulus griseus TaxID=10029 RepID=UPI0004543DC9|nr:eukaryotic translation initiation factor 3 subunit J isoform X1 [Cricetulus griseus]
MEERPAMQSVKSTTQADIEQAVARPAGLCRGWWQPVSQPFTEGRLPGLDPNWRLEVTASSRVGPRASFAGQNLSWQRADQIGNSASVSVPYGNLLKCVSTLPDSLNLRNEERKHVRITNGGSCLQDNWDDDDDENKEEAEVKPEVKISEKKKIAEKIKEKERQQKKRQEEIRKRLEEPEEPKVLTPEEQLADKLRLKKLQEESDLELAKETFGVNNTGYGIDAMNPSSRDDFTEFGKLLKDKITQYEKSLYYASFLEALVRDVCISLEIDDLKKITNSLTVLCSEKQKQEKQNKAKKKKKGVVPGGGLKATMKDDLADYGGYDGGYVQDYEDFM